MAEHPPGPWKEWIEELIRLGDHEYGEAGKLLMYCDLEWPVYFFAGLTPREALEAVMFQVSPRGKAMDSMPSEQSLILAMESLELDIMRALDVADREVDRAEGLTPP